MKRILIIEDEKILSDMYKFKLSKEGFEVISAIEVDEAIELAKKQIPDLVVLDMLLPKESGVNYLIKIKKIDNLKLIPVLVLTNFDDNQTRAQAFENGAKDYLIKSNHDPKEIVTRIKELLNQ
ncbi:MAG TPA: response regulator transcription factor [Candidatus Pacearchaeota archaeon]|nr:response regulator transcription factor [Candidatus Pacearchaeota archaeon]HPR80179.1 response regulator transcription factor [Candidatus Pacearchaeota archaeon]